MLLVVNQENPTTFDKIQAGTFNAFNIWERRHIQEWIRQAPEVLGEDLLVVSIEFDKFIKSSDRLDILAIDRKGNLVIVELKRDSMAGYADLQSIRYAAMMSSLTIEKLLPHYVSYQQKYLADEQANISTSLEQIKEFVTEQEDFKQFTNKPRIILCSEDFSTELTTTVLWLNQCGLDISCVRIKPHQIGTQIVIVPTKIIPLQEAQQYLIEIQHKEEVREQPTSLTKRPTTIRVLLENGCLHEGAIISMKDNLPSFVIYRDDNFFKAEITGKLGQKNTVKWLYDGKEYSISNLTHTIFTECHPEKQHPGALAGGEYWQAENGRNLYAWADEVWQSQN
ncbi:hypothetical protein BWI93_23815 [Siphonobacter sp. BAB-5385]|uniref:hypothetical protein n=1 Tax=Siphonobacter sp. BAB-5385 TaxID=1864822 RepID=UPI000B9E8028|nr:hypothetical protein [Siphonobacter sp. BAB-5385]OZI05719.1 hypothetical protein BWI93_23815 [Siphonobacter sp. BAB-5385]